MASFKQMGKPDNNILWDAIYGPSKGREGKGDMKKDMEKKEMKKADKMDKKMGKKEMKKK